MRNILVLVLLILVMSVLLVSFFNLMKEQELNIRYLNEVMSENN